MPPEIDMDLSPEERAFFDKKEAAKARQKKAREVFPLAPTEAEYDKQREANAAKQMAEAKAMAVTPASLAGGLPADPFSFPIAATPSLPDSNSVSVGVANVATPGLAPGAVSAHQVMVIWWAVVDAVDMYAESWDKLKELIKKHDGSWTAYQYELPLSYSNIFGFFKSHGYGFPECKSSKFDIIVRDGKVFKAEVD